MVPVGLLLNETQFFKNKFLILATFSVGELMGYGLLLVVYGLRKHPPHADQLLNLNVLIAEARKKVSRPVLTFITGC